MSIVDFGRRVARYLRLVRAKPGRVAELPDPRVGLEQLRADLAEQRTTAQATLEQLRADLAEQSTTAQARLEQLRADLAEQSMTAQARLEQLQAGIAEQITAARGGLEQLQAGIAEQITAARGGLEQLRSELAEQAAAARSGLAEVGADLMARTKETSRGIVSDLTAQIGFTSYDFDQQLSELADRLEAFDLNRRLSALDRLIVESSSRADEINAKTLAKFDVLDAQLAKTKDLLAHVNTTTEFRFNGLDTQLAEAKGLVTHVNTNTESRFNVLDTQIFETRNLVTHVNTSTESRFNMLDTQLSETKNFLTHVNTSNETRFNALDTQLSEAKNFLTYVNTSAESRFNVLGAQISETRSLLRQVDTNTASRLNMLDTQVFETKNLVTHVNTSTESRFNVLDTQLSETKNLVTHVNTSVHTRLNTLEFETINGLYDQLRELAANQFELHGKAGSNRAEWAAHPAERYKRARAASFESYLAKAKKDFPRLYPLWRERLDTMLNAFRETKTGNAAYGGDPDSRVFRSFVDMYAAGRVLDVGCGVFGQPYYLMDYPAKLISGLEPLPMIEPVSFELVRGISEYLPWPDESFSTVISATSLDHCMSLKRSLEEIGRVLRSEGRFLLWIDSVPGAPAYEPDKAEFKPADQFHLFHFNTSWFEPTLEQWFRPVTQTQLRRNAFSRIMYCLVKK